MRAKILIAHGNTQQLERAVSILSAAGFEVVATPDGGDAFARFFEELPDLVICGENLPVLDGPSFGRMIHSQNPRLPVVLLVADPEVADASEFLILKEPLSVDGLLALVPEIRPVSKPKSSTKIALPGPATDEASVNDEIHQILQRFQNAGNILALLDADGLERLARLAVIQDRTPGERVIQEGDPCDGFYLVVDGEVRITLTERDNQEVARLSAGEFFGEMALLSNQPRSASVWALGATRLMWFEKEAVLRLLEDYPGLREVLGGVAVQRAEENLWQALSDDGDVQRNLSDLLEGIDLPQLGSPAATTAGSGENRALGVGRADRSTPANTASSGVRRTPSAGLWWLRYQALRIAVQQHRFAIGVAIGVVSGIALAGGLTIWIVRNPPGAASGEVPPLAGSNADRAVPDRWVPPLDLAAEPFGAGPLSPPAVTASSPAVDRPEPVVPKAAAFDTPPVLAEPALPAVDEKPTLVVAEPTKPTATSTPPTGAPPLERKLLRRHLFDAFKNGRFAEAVTWGTQLREAYTLDWESHILLANAERESGQSKLALQDYLAFVESYPNYVATDDAQFWAAELLMADGKVAEARALYQAVARNPKSDFRTSAELRLQALSKEKSR
jgi:CRP-like cAMP-binding protein/CheY-like chemotaxis protein